MILAIITNIVIGLCKGQKESKEGEGSAVCLQHMNTVQDKDEQNNIELHYV